MKRLKYILEYPYRRYLNWKNRNKRNINRSNHISVSINIWNLLLFYLIGLGIITISLAVFIGIYLIFKDIML